MTDRRRSQLLDWLAAAVTAGLLLLAVGWLWPGADQPFPGHGARFAAMAIAPFAFDGEIPQRVLWPALAWLAAKVGIGPVAFSQVCSWFLLTVVCWFARQRTRHDIDAALVTALVAESGAVLLYQQPMACYSDQLNLALLLLTVHAASRPFAFWGLVLLAAFSHEMAFFLSPWLWWLRCRAGGSWWRDGAWFLATLGVYTAFRLLVAALGPATGPTYGFVYYLLHNWWVPWLLPGLWALWALVTLAEFGPLLALAVVAWRRGEAGTGGRVGAWLYVGSLSTLMLLAYDVMRFASFFVLPVVLGAIAVLRTRHGRPLVGALCLLAAISYRLGHPLPEQQGGAVFTRVAGEMMVRAAPRVREHEPMAFADALAVQRESFAATWGTWLAVALAFAAVAGLGLWLARYVGSASEGGSEPRTQRNASP